MIYVIGKTGLVGSAICAYFEKKGIEYTGINRENYKQYIGGNADCLINANGSGLKSQANENPQLDFEKNVTSTVNYVFDFKYKTFIHISSIDVYSDPGSLEKTREDHPIEETKLIPYGFHKYLAESIVRRYCPRWLILRLGGLVGANLKKNPVYDWTHDKPFLISQESRLTFIHTETVAHIVEQLLRTQATNEIINVCSSDSIRLKDLAAIHNFKMEEAAGNKPPVVQNYNINVGKLKKIFSLGTSRQYIEKYLKENLLASGTK